MAHRLSELMHQVETITEPVAQKAAQQECENLIFQLWEQRADWPYGGPLDGLMPTLQRMLAPKAKYYQWLDGPLDEEGLLGKLIRIHTKELHLFQQLLVLQASPEAVELSEEWTREHLDNLSNNERDILRFVIRAARPDGLNQDINAQVEEDFEESEDDEADKGSEIIEEPEAVTLSPAQRILAALVILQTKRQKLFDTTKKIDKPISED